METNARTNAGIDVGSKTLQLAILRGEAYDEGEFDNTPAGHKKLAAFIAKRGKGARVCVEATGLQPHGRAGTTHPCMFESGPDVILIRTLAFTPRAR